MMYSRSTEVDALRERYAELPIELPNSDFQALNACMTGCEAVGMGGESKVLLVAFAECHLQRCSSGDSREWRG